MMEKPIRTESAHASVCMDEQRYEMIVMGVEMKVLICMSDRDIHELNYIKTYSSYVEQCRVKTVKNGLLLPGTEFNKNRIFKETEPKVPPQCE